MAAVKKYDPTLPRTIADLIHKYGFRTAIEELAAYCKVEWVQAEIRGEEAEHWREAGVTLVRLLDRFPSQE